jgi:hypothetical protein
LLDCALKRKGTKTTHEGTWMDEKSERGRNGQKIDFPKPAIPMGKGVVWWGNGCQ